jgi:hypothetical protein
MKPKGLHSYQRGDKQVRFYARANAAWLLRGSTWTCESLPGPTETHFHIGAFDQAALLEPTNKHYFVEERLPWLHTGNP